MKSPKMPSPQATAAAQTASNKETADYQSALNNVSQYTPDGSLVYSQDGTWSNGAPKYTATQSLSPAQQQLYNTNTATEQNLANIGKAQSAKVGQYLNNPFDLNSASETKYDQMARSRLDPQWQQKREGFEQQLINRGVRPGSEAYNSGMGQFGQQENDAYNSMYLQGKQLFNQEAMAERNQPINEITALMSGSQVSQPNFVGTPQTAVQGTDVAGITRDYYNSKNASSQAAMGGLFGLAAAPFGMFNFSDRRLKKNIRHLHDNDNGLGVYEYEYIFAPGKHVGVMADEVEVVMPEAVAEISGFKVVNYSMIGA